jgi:Zn-dependent protease
MLRSFRLGKIRGIDVNIHPTFGLVFVWALVQWGLSPNGGVTPFLLGCVFVVLVFFSVLLHELGHCAMALQYGTRVLDITLWPIGGVARIEQMPVHPRGEVLISLAGPAINLAIFVAILPVLLFIAVVGGGDAVLSEGYFLDGISPIQLLTYLAIVNIVIMLFNLLPAFPMDGGRVLRAVLATPLGRERATSVAVGVGISFAVVMLAIGLWQRQLGLIIFAVFVMLAAHAEGRTVRVESAMRRLRVGQFALWDMGGVAPHHPLTFALRGGPRDLVVTDNGEVIGMLWRSQLLEGLNGGIAGRTIGDIMDTSIYIADVDDSVYEVQQQMIRRNRWAVPVTEGGQYRGIFTAERFVHLYRQIAPLPSPPKVALPPEWRDAVSESWRAFRRRR